MLMANSALAQPDTALWAPVGASVGHRKCLAGTLGCYVRCTTSQRIGLLSNWHVLSHSLAQPGDQINWHRPTQQPTFTQYKQHIPIAQLGQGFIDADGDAAVAWLTPEATQFPVELGSFTGTRRAQVGDILAKVGASSGLTRARVTACGPFPLVFAQRVISINAIQLEPLDEQPQHQTICAAGDSGSVWFDEKTNQAVALHFAGQPNPFVGPVNAQAADIETVLMRLNVSIL